MPFCKECKSLVYPTKDGKLTCRKCGWTSTGPAKKQMVRSHTAEGKAQVIIEQSEDTRPQQNIECPKCGHDKAYFHLMQTRRSDEPPTEINECVKCGHKWREY